MRLSRATASVLLFARLANCQGSREPDDLAPILEETRSRYSLPAVGAIVGPQNQPTVVGIRKLGTTVAATNDDIWHLGSCTKSMTATVVAILIERGYFSWTSSIGDLVGFPEMLEVYRNVTVELVTAQRGGIVSDALETPGYDPSLYDIEDPAEGRRVMVETALSAPTRLQQGTYEYANINYILAGRIIDIATNRTAEEWFQELLFDPLSITTAGWGPNPESSNTSIDNPYPHYVANGTIAPFPEDAPFNFRDNPPGVSTSGTLHMSLADWSKYLAAHLDGSQGRLPCALDLSAESFEKLHSRYVGDNSTGVSVYTYGGWFRAAVLRDGGYTLWHDGTNTYNFALAYIDSGPGRTYGVSTNAFGTGDGGIVDGIWGLMGQLRARDVMNGTETGV